PLELGLAGVEPGGEIGGRKDHRHAVVNRREFRICRAGDDGSGVDLAAVAIRPRLPDAGAGPWAARTPVDEKRTPELALALPLIEAVGRHKAAPPPDCRAVGRLLRNSLDTRVEEKPDLFRVLRPIWDQPPASERKTPRAVLVAHEPDRLRRRD